MASGKSHHETGRKLRPLRSFSCDVYSGYSNIALRRAMKPSLGATTPVKSKRGISERFEVAICLYQGSALSLFLFIMLVVVQQLSKMIVLFFLEKHDISNIVCT